MTRASAARRCNTRCRSIRTVSCCTASRVPQIVQQLSNNNANAGGGFFAQGGQFYYVRGLGLVKSLEDIGNIVVASRSGIPVTVKDVGTSRSGVRRGSGNSATCSRTMRSKA